MLTCKPNTPEARLSVLLDLAERAARILVAQSGSNYLIRDALEEADKVLATQIRNVCAELGKAPPAPVAPREFKVRDHVRVLGSSNVELVDSLEKGDEGVIVAYDESGTSREERLCCWRVRCAMSGDMGWHRSDQLELIEG